MVLSGTVWTPETVEDWLFRNCWPMGYHNFDSRKKADMRARILHAIELLSKWSSAVAVKQPLPEKTISAHDAMGGSDVMGGGEFGGNNGWSYSFGKWPNQVQQQQQPSAPVSSVQFPIPTTTPAAAAAGPVNVRDWVKDGDLQRGPSPSPPSHNRRSSIGNNRNDIFIPPENNWINPNHHPPISFRPRSRNPTPDPTTDWHHSAEPSNNNINITNNSFPPSGSRVPRADPYSLESFDRSINSMLHQSQHRNANLAAAAIPSNSQRVIPINLTRKQNKRRRKKERERERQSKWIPLNGLGADSDVSDSSDDDDEEVRAWYPPPATATTLHHHHQPPQQQQQQQQLRIPVPPPPMQQRSLSRQDPSNHHLLPHPSLTSGPAPVSMSMPQPPPPHMHIGLHSPPQSFGPAQLAQYQFEQQHKVYHFQKQQQEQQQQQHYLQQQQHQQQQQQFHHLLQQHSQQPLWQSTGVAIYR